MYAIRSAKPDDLTPLDALFARSYPRLLKADYPPSVLVTALPALSRAQPALLACGTYYVAEEDGRLIGAGGWTARRQGRAEVRHVVTDDRELRRGVGRAILTRAFASAREARATWMHCMSTRTAEPFYRALGFSRIGETSVSLGPGIDFPAVEMWRAL